MNTSVSQRAAATAWRAPWAATQTLLVAAGSTAAVGVVARSPGLIVAGCGVFFAVLVTFRFELFLLGALVVRAALDHFRTGSIFSPATVLGAAVLVLVFGAEFLARVQGQPRRALSAPFRLPLQILLIAGVLSMATSTSRKDSAVEVLRIAGVLAMIIALERLLVTLDVARRVLVAVLVSALVPMGFALLQVAQGQGRLIGGFSRITGTFLHPSPFSIYLALLIVMAVALFQHVNGFARLALGAGAMVACGCLLLTYTRGSWIALVVGLLVVGLLQSRRLALGILAGVVIVVLSVPSVGQRFADLQAPVKYSGATSNSLIWRVDYWNQVLSLSKDSPILGIGLKGIENSTQDAKNAHNDLVRTYVETGILGLAAYLALAVSLLATARRAVRAKVAGWRRGAAVGFAGMVATLAVVSLSSNVITQVVLLWYVAALGMVAVAVTASDTQSQTGDTAGHAPGQELVKGK